MPLSSPAALTTTFGCSTSTRTALFLAFTLHARVFETSVDSVTCAAVHLSDLGRISARTSAKGRRLEEHSRGAVTTIAYL